MTAEIIKLIDSGKFVGSSETARALGCSYALVTKVIKEWRDGKRIRLNLEAAKIRHKQRKPRRGSKAEAIVQAFYRGGVRNFSELAREVGVTPQCVDYVLKTWCNYKTSPRRHKGRMEIQNRKKSVAVA